MVRSKVTLAFIRDASARKATFKKRSKSVTKLTRELSILCDVMACAIIYGLDSDEPVVWPSTARVKEVLARFSRMPEHKKVLKMASQESLVRDTIKKARKRLMRLERENRRKEVGYRLMSWVRGEATTNQTMLALSNMGSFLQEKISYISWKVEEKKKENLVSAGAENVSQNAEMMAGVVDENLP